MKKKIVSIGIGLGLVVLIGVVLANNKSKIDLAANPKKIKPQIPVKAIEVKEDTFSTSFTLNGETSPVREVTIASEVQGKLVNLLIKNGDRVSARQAIASLDASVYTAQLRSLEYSISKAELDLERYKRLIDLGGATPLQLESVRINHESLLAQKKEVLQQMDHMQIRAPFSGTMENLLVEKGSYVSFGTKLAELIDNSALKIQVYLSENEAFRVVPGQPISISSPVLSHPVEGKIAMLSDKADASGKFLAEIHYVNTGEEKLKAGMITDVAFVTGSTSTGLSIPASALTGSAKHAKVFVVKEDKAELREISTGIVTPTKVQVTGGLKAGEQVVVSGQLNLETGTSISIIK